MMKSNRSKQSSHYEDDPSEIKIDHNSGMPRVATKKRKTVKQDEAPEPEREALPLDGPTSRPAKRRASNKSSTDALNGKKDSGAARRARPVHTTTDISSAGRTVGDAKRKAARLKALIPSEESLLAELPVASTTQEQEHLDEYLHMFRKLRRLIRKAEKDCLETNNPRAYYAVCTLYSAQREVIADIRSVSDASGQVKYLNEYILQPLTRSVGQNLLDVYYQVRKLIIETSNPKDTQFAIARHDELTKEQGRFLQATYQDYVEKTSKYLLGPQ